jgi:hypothetical protein
MPPQATASTRANTTAAATAAQQPDGWVEATGASFFIAGTTHCRPVYSVVEPFNSNFETMGRQSQWDGQTGRCDGRLSKRSLGWMKLGIVNDRIQAHRPQQNGHHERMPHAEQDTTKLPAASLCAQQSRFDNFRYVFNNERPYEGLNNPVPASLYHPSSVRLPRKLPEFNYRRASFCDG